MVCHRTDESATLQGVAAEFLENKYLVQDAVPEDLRRSICWFASGFDKRFEMLVLSRSCRRLAQLVRAPR